MATARPGGVGCTRRAGPRDIRRPEPRRVDVGLLRGMAGLAGDAARRGGDGTPPRRGTNGEPGAPRGPLCLATPEPREARRGGSAGESGPDDDERDNGGGGVSSSSSSSRAGSVPMSVATRRRAASFVSAVSVVSVRALNSVLFSRRRDDGARRAPAGFGRLCCGGFFFKKIKEICEWRLRFRNVFQRTCFWCTFQCCIQRSTNLHRSSTYLTLKTLVLRILKHNLLFYLLWIVSFPWSTTIDSLVLISIV